MNIGDKTKSVTIRLSSAQLDFLKNNADSVGLTISKYLRVMISSVMALDKLSDKPLGEVADTVVSSMLSEASKKN